MASDYKNILLIEDETGIAEIYATMLGAHGFEVVCRYDGQSGLSEAQQKPYDLILLDLMLPNVSGMEILRTLRDPKRSPNFDQHTDVIILTNFEEDDATKKEMLSMAKDYLIKVNMTPHSLVNYLKGEAPATPKA